MKQIARTANREQGQGLVEFALVFPIFWVMLIAFVEFALLFNAMLAIGFASRDAALVASEVGNSVTADCSILRSIENNITAPASASHIQTIDIYWADVNGAQIGANKTTYTRNEVTPMTCTVLGHTYTFSYQLTTNGYPPANRCNIIIGCGGGHPGLDTIGVKITYQYNYYTPYGLILGNGGVTLTWAGDMQMEPVQ